MHRILRLILPRIFRGVILFYIGWMTHRIGVLMWGWPKYGQSPEALLIVLAILFVGVVFTLLPARKAPALRWVLALWVLVFLLSVPFFALQYALGVSDLETILVFFEGTTVSTTANFATGVFQGSVFKILLLSFCYILTMSFMHLRVKYFGGVLLGIAAALIVLHPVSRHFRNVLFPSAQGGAIYAGRDAYQLQIESRPRDKKNLLLIYLEGLEQGYLRVPEMQPYTRPLQQLARDSVEFRDVAQVHGTHFSAAGLVASQCGVPLLPSATFDVHKSKVLLKGGVYPRLTCLADVLNADGYDTSFFVAADFAAYSYGAFLSGHSWSHLFGNANVTQTEMAEYGSSVWGVSDQLIFEKAGAKLVQLAKQDVPFLMAVQTIITHGPDGVRDKNCHDAPDHSSNMPAALSCTSKYVMGIVELVKNLGLSEDTVIAVMSDHLAWENMFTAKLEAQPRRRNLFFLLNSGKPAAINKNGVAFDVFPTLLDALGYELRNDRGNMGVSLLRDQPSMIDQYGLENLTNGLKGNRDLARWLWRPKDPRQ